MPIHANPHQANIRSALQAAKNWAKDLVMKDVHTLHNDPGRLGGWMLLAREEIDHA